MAVPVFRKDVYMMRTNMSSIMLADFFVHLCVTFFKEKRKRNLPFLTLLRFFSNSWRIARPPDSGPCRTEARLQSWQQSRPCGPAADPAAQSWTLQWTLLHKSGPWSGPCFTNLDTGMDLSYCTWTNAIKLHKDLGVVTLLN